MKRCLALGALALLGTAAVAVATVIAAAQRRLGIEVCLEDFTEDVNG